MRPGCRTAGSIRHSPGRSPGSANIVTGKGMWEICVSNSRPLMIRHCSVIEPVTKWGFGACFVPAGRGTFPGVAAQELHEEGHGALRKAKDFILAGLGMMVLGSGVLALAACGSSADTPATSPVKAKSHKAPRTS